MIDNLLKDKKGKAKVRVKAKEICKVNHIGKTKKGKLEIEITAINEIDGGVEVFARAWNGKKQIGFGKDGTVDLERFVFKNPPILVEDPNGDIVRETEIIDSATGETTILTRKLREDPKEAILQALEHTISVKKQKFDDKKIIKGKIGNTTTTFYPDADPETDSFDGSTYGNNWNTTWSTVRDQTGNGTYCRDDLAQSNSGYSAATRRHNPLGYETAHSIYTFAYNLTDGDNIDSATFSVYVTAKDNAENDGNDYIALVQQTRRTGAQTAIATTDHEIEYYEGDKLASDIDIGDITTSAYNDWALNATGLALLSASGDDEYIHFGHIEGHDWADDAMTTYGDNMIFNYYADQAGTANDPKLVIEHTLEADDIKNNATLSTNLISCWLSDSSGLTTDLVVASGNDLDNNNSVTEVAGKQGDAGDFESGSSQSLSIDDGDVTGLDITGDISIACWLNFETVAGDLTFASKSNNSGSQISWELKHEDGLNWGLILSANGSSVEKYELAFVPSTGTWYHFAVSLDISAKTAEFFIDGQSIGTDATGTASSMFNSSAPFRIGAGRDDTHFFDGIINQMCVWTKVLTASEVEALYNGGDGIPYEAGGGGVTFVPKIMIF